MANPTVHREQTMGAPAYWCVAFPRSAVKTVCLSAPLLLLLGAYIHMAFKYDTLWLFDTVVHERGRYTLWEVMFYFRHFLWELPIKTVFCIFLVGVFHWFGKPRDTRIADPAPVVPCSGIVICAMLALVIGGGAFWAAARELGAEEAFLGLAQYRTSELRPALFGSHWRNHFLSNIVLFATTGTGVVVYRLMVDNGVWGRRRFSLLLPLSLFLFVGATLFFGMNLDPFQVPGYLGHQLREIFGTDLTVTLPLSLGILMYLEEKYDPPATGGMIPPPRESVAKTLPYILWMVIPAVLISLFLILKVAFLDTATEIAKLGSTAGWTKLDLFAWHFFEHTLDYLYVMALACFLYLLTLRLDLKRTLSV